jgi:hypothetical protein
MLLHNTKWRQVVRDAFVEEIGEQNVVQLVIDNGSNYVLAGKLLTEIAASQPSRYSGCRYPSFGACRSVIRD